MASTILAPLALATQYHTWRKLDRRAWALMLVSGVILAVHFYTWIASLAMTSVAASVVLVTTHPLFVGLLSHFILKERLNRPMIIGMLIAFAGSFIIGIEDVGQGTHRLVGDLLALVGGLAMAIYMLIGRRLRAQLSLLGYIFPVYGTAAVVLMIAALLTRSTMTGFAPLTWAWVLLMALFPQIVGHSSFNWALAHLPATYVSLTILAEPVGSVLLVWLILKEPPSWASVIGGILILGGIVLASRKPRRNAPQHPERM
jgi:drug/metabolite transporter (DMT)-like permease